MLAQTPVFMGVPNVGKTDSFDGYSCVVPDAGSIAAAAEHRISAPTPAPSTPARAATSSPTSWPHGTASTRRQRPVSWASIDKESDDAILSGNTDLSGAVTTDGQPDGPQTNLTGAFHVPERPFQKENCMENLNDSKALAIEIAKILDKKEGPRRAGAQGGEPDRPHRLLSSSPPAPPPPRWHLWPTRWSLSSPRRGWSPTAPRATTPRTGCCWITPTSSCTFLCPTPAPTTTLEHLWADGEPVDISEYLTPDSTL